MRCYISNRVLSPKNWRFYRAGGHCRKASAVQPLPLPRCRQLRRAVATSAVLTHHCPAARYHRRRRAIPAALLPRCHRCHAATTVAALLPPPRHCHHAISASMLLLLLPSFLLSTLLPLLPRYRAATAGCRCRAIAAAALPAAQPPHCPPLPRCHHRCRAATATAVLPPPPLPPGCQ